LSIKPAPIWDRLGPEQRGDLLRRSASMRGAWLGQTAGCAGNVIRLQAERPNPIRHTQFGSLRCSDHRPMLEVRQRGRGALPLSSDSDQITPCEYLLLDGCTYLNMGTIDD
jgi:hypothetical protein